MNFKNSCPLLDGYFFLLKFASAIWKSSLDLFITFNFNNIKVTLKQNS